MTENERFLSPGLRWYPSIIFMLLITLLFSRTTPSPPEVKCRRLIHLSNTWLKCHGVLFCSL